MNRKTELTRALQADVSLASGRTGRVAKKAMMKLTTAVLGFGLVVLSACAQQPGAKTYQEQEKRWQSCPDGYYSGPRPGRLNYNNDKYLWVVTPEFARRFCMPEQMVDPELKGAEAIAFKRVPSEDGNDRCAVQEDGKTRCVDDGVGRFEVYLKSDLNLPAARPEVKFFDGERNNSGWHISAEARANKCLEYRQDSYLFPLGAINHFGNNCHHPDPGYGFALVSTWRKRNDHSIVDSLWEVGYRADWAPGMDILILESRGLGMELSFLANHPRAKEWGGIERYAIVLADYRRGAKPHDEKRFPTDYEHVVYLPQHFAEQVKSAAENLGTWTDVMRTFRQP